MSPSLSGNGGGHGLGQSPGPNPLLSPRRTKLLESEAMNESLRRSLSRASARSPYSLGASPGAPAFGGSPASSMEDASEVIRRAKQDLERLKKKEIRQRRKRCMEGSRCPLVFSGGLPQGYLGTH